MPARAAIYSRSQAYTNAISSANAATVTSANKTSAISHSLSLPQASRRANEGARRALVLLAVGYRSHAGAGWEHGRAGASAHPSEMASRAWRPAETHPAEPAPAARRSLPQPVCPAGPRETAQHVPSCQAGARRAGSYRRPTTAASRSPLSRMLLASSCFHVGALALLRLVAGAQRLARQPQSLLHPHKPAQQARKP